MSFRQYLRNRSAAAARADANSRDFLKSPATRAAWHQFYVCTMLAMAGIMGIGLSPIGVAISESPSAVATTRFAFSAAFGISLLLLFRLAVSYFSLALRTNREIRFDTVLVFYVAGTLLFGAIHYYLFSADPTLYAFDPEQVYWSPSIGSRSLQSWKARALFALYSALKSVGGTLSYIEAKSVYVSILNYLQSLFSFGLVSLLVAAYVNQRTTR